MPLTHSTASGPSVSYSGTVVMLYAWAAASSRTHSAGGSTAGAVQQGAARSLHGETRGGLVTGTHVPHPVTRYQAGREAHSAFPCAALPH